MASMPRGDVSSTLFPVSVVPVSRSSPETKSPSVRLCPLNPPAPYLIRKGIEILPYCDMERCRGKSYAQVNALGLISVIIGNGSPFLQSIMIIFN